jgi:hypothetical protein
MHSFDPEARAVAAKAREKDEACEREEELTPAFDHYSRTISIQWRFCKRCSKAGGEVVIVIV